MVTNIPTTTNVVPTTTNVVTTNVAPTTTVAPIDAALAAMLKHNNVATLWEENVTKASNIITKLFGLISYYWNESDAIKKDKVACDFQSKATDLVKAVADRTLNQEESTKLGLSPVRFSNGKAQALDGQLKIDADNKLNEFYSVFKQRVAQLGSTESSENYGVYAAAAEKLITNLSKSKEVLPGLKAPATLPIRIETTTNGFKSRILDDMINSFADQPLDAITIDGYKAKVALIKGYFLKNDTIEIEAKLRQQIIAKHDTTQFDGILTALSDPAANNPKVAEIRTAQKTKLTEKKAALEVDIKAMRGDNGFNGTIHTASEKKRIAQEAMGQSEAALRVALGAFQNVAGSNIDQLLTLVTQFLAAPTTTTAAPTSTTAVNVAALQGLLIDLQTKKQAFEAANKELTDLTTKFNQMVTYAAGTDTVNGGDLKATNDNLVDAALDASASAEAGKLVQFYTELGRSVEDNSTARSNAYGQLRGIIGN